MMIRGSMLPSNWMRNRSSTSWLFGLVGSALAHVGLLLVLFVFGRDAAADAAVSASELAAMTATPIDLVADLGAADQPSQQCRRGAGGGRAPLGCACRRQGQHGGGHRRTGERRRARARRACA